MTEISINPENIKTQEEVLLSLKQSLDIFPAVLPELKGEGSVASDAMALGEKLLEIKECLCELFAYTAGFLENAENSYVTADTTVSTGYRT